MHDIRTGNLVFVTAENEASRPERDADPRNWKLDVDPAAINLYLSLLDEPRALTAGEASLMVDLVDAWRAGEHEKHIALMSALRDVRRFTERS